MDPSGRDSLDVLFAAAGRAPQGHSERFDPEAALARQRLLARVLGQADRAYVRLGRFHVLRCIGRGGMGTVFQATDGATGGVVALKLLEDASEQALMRLKREFRALCNLSHPHLVTMYELQVERELPFFTMELIRGPALSQLLGASASLSVSFVSRCLAQLTEALCTLHREGILHGDIKPSNILVRRGGRLVVVDFGVARALKDATSGVRSGTPAYLAPERQRGEAFAEPADWYAVGAVLRQLLERVRTPEDQAAHTRLEALRNLQRGLLTDDPKHRHGAAQILVSLGATSTPRLERWPAEDTSFAGRETELEQLRGALAIARHRPVLCTVSGEAGLGKTALVEHFLSSPGLAQALALRGRCYEAECIPYRGVDGLIEGLTVYLMGLPEPVRNAHTGSDTDALLQVFPVLQRVCTVPTGPRPVALSARQVRQRAYEQLLRLLASLGRERAVVIFIDDLQWADADGAELLAHLASDGAPPMLLLAGFRSDAEGPWRDALASASEPLQITLGPLESDACYQLSKEARGGSVERSYSDLLLRESGGSPLLLHALLRTESAPGDHARTYAQLMNPVIAGLDGPARELLALVVLAGCPASLALLTAAAEHVEQPRLSMAALRARRLVRTVLRDDETLLLPHHDRVRELVAEGLAPVERRAFHSRLARAARTLALDDPEFLANHHFRADERVAAGHQAERAGDRARSTMALSRASELYLRALECAAPSRPLALVEKLANLAASAGDLTTAGPLYLVLAAARPRDSWMLRLRAAEVFLQQGAEQEGMRLLRPAMREARIPVPTNITRALWMGGLSLLRSYRSGRSLSALGAQSDRPDDPRTELAFRAGHLICLHDAKGAALILWSAARALRHGSTSQRGRSLASLAYVYCMLGFSTNDEQDALVSRSLLLTAKDPLAHVAALASKALIAFARCQCDDALHALDTLRTIAEGQRLDAQWILGQIHSVEASVCVLAGDFRRIDAFGADAEQKALQLGNRTVLAQVQSSLAWASLARGDSEAMRRYAVATCDEWRSRWISPIYGIAVWGECHRLLYEGDTQAAFALMQTEAPRFARSAFAHTQMWSTALSQLWGSVELACASAGHDRHFHAAEKHAARLERHHLPCAKALATLLRAGLSRRAGQTALAREAYSKAKRDLAALGMRGFAASAAQREAQLARAPADQQLLDWFAQQSIADPSAWVRMCAP